MAAARLRGIPAPGSGTLGNEPRKQAAYRARHGDGAKRTDGGVVAVNVARSLAASAVDGANPLECRRQAARGVAASHDDVQTVAETAHKANEAQGNRRDRVSSFDAAHGFC